MARKLISFFMSLVFAHATSAFGSDVQYTTFINYYFGPILKNSGTDYSQVNLPTFSFQSETINSTNFGSLSTFCFHESNKCIVTSTMSDRTIVLAADDQSALNVSTNRLPIGGHIVFARIDAGSLNTMMARSEYRYEVGDDKDVDDKIFACGLGAAGCVVNIMAASSGWGAIGAVITCTGAARLCANAAKAMNKYEADKAKEASDKASQGSGGGGEGGSGKPSEGKPTTLETRPLPTGTVTIHDIPHPHATGGGGSSSGGIIHN